MIRERPAGKQQGAQTDLVALAGGEEVSAEATITQETKVTVALVAKPEPEKWEPWQDPDELVITEQPATCCYVNHSNQIVLRQKAPYPEEDACLFFNMEYAPAIIRAMAVHLSPGAMNDVLRALDANYL
jgi:hypothetical protein